MSLADSYTTLGLSVYQKYSKKQLHTAYLQCAKRTHPDANPLDREATRRFQYVSQCYETVQLHQGIEDEKHEQHGGWYEQDTNASFDPETIQAYHQAYERLLYKIQTFWNTSPEAKLAREVWQTFQNTKTPCQNTKTQNKSKAPNSSLDVSFVLQISLADVYHCAPQKLSFARNVWDDERCEHVQQEVSLLVRVEFKCTTFYGEGHRGQDGARGDVSVCVEPNAIDRYSVKADGLLHRELVVPKEKMGRPSIVDVFGRECFFVVPHTLLTTEPTPVVVNGVGLYDTETGQRGPLVVDCVCLG